MYCWLVECDYDVLDHCGWEEKNTSNDNNKLLKETLIMIKGLKNISTWTMSCWFTLCFCKIIFISKEDYGALWLGVQHKWRNKTLTIKHCQRHNGTMLSQEDPNTLFAKNLAKILRTLQKNLCVCAPLIHAKVLPGSALCIEEVNIYWQHCKNDCWITSSFC